MSTQLLLDKITAERDAQIAVIEAETKATISSIEAATAVEVEKVKIEASAASEKEVAQIKRAALSKARQAGKLAVQTARREELDTIMAEAEKTVVAESAENARLFADRKPVLEMEIAKQLG